jgi:phosphoribosylamine--glycine ligase
LQNDLVELMLAATTGKLAEQEIQIDERAATAVILVSGGYPEAYEKGKIIKGEESVEGSLVFHAGTRKQDDQILTNGGRVMAITSMEADFKKALEQSYRNAQKIQFAGKYYRGDIGFDL